jgi:hypothetical protein
VTTFQLDECLDDASLAADCNATGKCTVVRYPRRLKGMLDGEMLRVVFSQDTTLWTFDRTIIEDNPQSIVSPNPGIIVIQKQTPHPPMTSRRARAIIENFKNHIPSWPNIDWSMVYAEIDEQVISVCPLTDADTSNGRPFAISDAAADAELTLHIAALHESLKGSCPSSD